MKTYELDVSCRMFVGERIHFNREGFEGKYFEVLKCRKKRNQEVYKIWVKKIK